MANLLSTTINEGINGNTETAAVTNGQVQVNVGAGNVFTADLQNSNADITTFAFANFSPYLPTGHVTSFILKIIQGSTARQFTWSSLTDFKWPEGTSPTLAVTDNAIDILSFMTFDTSSPTWYGLHVGHDLQ